MTDNSPPKAPEINMNVYLADALLRLSTLEHLLIEKNVFTRDEFIKVLEEIAQKAAQAVLNNTPTPKNVEETTIKSNADYAFIKHGSSEVKIDENGITIDTNGAAIVEQINDKEIKITPNVS